MKEKERKLERDSIMDSLALSGSVTEYLSFTFVKRNSSAFAVPERDKFSRRGRPPTGSSIKERKSRRKSDKEYVFAGRRNFRLAYRRAVNRPRCSFANEFLTEMAEKRQEVELTAGLTVCNLSLDSQMGIGRLRVLGN